VDDEASDDQAIDHKDQKDHDQHHDLILLDLQVLTRVLEQVGINRKDISEIGILHVHHDDKSKTLFI
jgi:hypothetical protein